METGENIVKYGPNLEYEEMVTDEELRTVADFFDRLTREGED